MALTLDPTRCAVLAMDFQNDIMEATPNYREKHLLETASRVLDAALQHGATVIHIRLTPPLVVNLRCRDIPVPEPLLYLCGTRFKVYRPKVLRARACPGRGR